MGRIGTKITPRNGPIHHPCLPYSPAAEFSSKRGPTRRRHATASGYAPDGGSTAHSEPHDRNGDPAAARPAARRRWVRRRYRGVIARHAQDTPATQPTVQAAAAATTADRIQPAPGPAPCTSRGAGWAISSAAGSSTGRAL